MIATNVTVMSTHVQMLQILAKVHKAMTKISGAIEDLTQASAVQQKYVSYYTLTTY